MAKRGRFNPGAGIFRISVPGVNVDTATQAQLLLDERVIYPQILQSIYVPNPLNGTPFDVVYVNNGFVPHIYAYAVYSTGVSNRAFPANNTWDTGSGGGRQNHFFYYPYAAFVRMQFPTPSALLGAQIILMRPQNG